jgi:hypothetical protein
VAIAFARPEEFALTPLTLRGKVQAMEPNWAAEHLQTIRTLMERSALYRRALAPVFTFVGAVGVAAAAGAPAFHIHSPREFAIYWMAVCLAVLVGAFALIRLQALRNSEVFWSPPTRRIAAAILPALLLGLLFGLFVIRTNDAGETRGVTWALIIIWTLLYGLALHAAGFFMPRGIRLFGWIFLAAGVALLIPFWFRLLAGENNLYSPNPMMGLLFGGLHLAYGVYLYFTEKRKNEA